MRASITWFGHGFGFGFGVWRNSLPWQRIWSVCFLTVSIYVSFDRDQQAKETRT